MGRWIVAVLIVLLLSLVGIAVFGLLLWWLLSRQKAEEPAPPVEIDVALPAADAEGLEVASMTEAPPLVVEPPDVDVLDVDAIDFDVIDVDVKDVEEEWDVPALDSTLLEAEAEVDESGPEVEVETKEPAEEAAPPPPDDLKRIDGIGPKISGVLQAAGIMTFADLAASDVSRLQQVLEAESPTLLRLADPTTWPEQAQLAAAGEWEALEALQGTLKGGRRT